MKVLFLRIPATSSEGMTLALARYYDDGWRVVSHADDGREYSFVLERAATETDTFTRLVEQDLDEASKGNL